MDAILKPAPGSLVAENHDYGKKRAVIACNVDGLQNEWMDEIKSQDIDLQPLDEIDHRLLDLLQADASRTNQALAAAAGVSSATALRRVRRLVEAGVIERQVALLAPRLASAGLSAIVELTLDRQGAEHLDAFEARAVAEDAVQQCYRVSPGPDFVLVAWVVDMPAWSALVQRLFTQDANVRNVKTYFAVSRGKFAPRIATAPRASA